jgi:hypothetical protein
MLVLGGGQLIVSLLFFDDMGVRAPVENARLGLGPR